MAPSGRTAASWRSLNRVPVRIKLDANLGRSVEELFTRAGHDVATVYDQGLVSTSDEEVFDPCVAERRALVTLDLDLSNPRRFGPTVGRGWRGAEHIRLPSRQDLGVAAALIDGLEDAPIPETQPFADFLTFLTIKTFRRPVRNGPLCDLRAPFAH